MANIALKPHTKPPVPEPNRMLDLVEEPKRSAAAAALMTERETAASDRAAELSKANDAMRQAIESLAIEPDLISFAGRLLMIVGQQFGAPVVEYWTHDSPHVAKLSLTCRDGHLYPGSDIADDPRVSGIVIPQQMTGVQDLYAQRAYFLSDDLPNDATQKAVFSPLGLDLGSWCRERGVRKYLNVPLRSGDRTFGALVIYIPREQQFTDVRIELAYALAHQLTLAIRLTDLALESQRATIALERESSARARATALARANEALRRGAERIATVSDDSNAILDVFLLEAVRAVNASAGTIVRRANENGTECFMQSLAQDGKLIRPSNTYASDIRYRSATAEDKSGVMRRTFEGETFLFKVDEIMAWFPEAYTYHVDQGHRVIGHFPLMTKRHSIGYLGLAFREEEVDEMSLETVKVLAGQASMALEMKRLADEARVSAVALEQDRATKERSAELAKANKSITDSLRRMATESNLSRMPGMILLEVCKHAGADSCCWLDYDPDHHTLNLALRSGQSVVSDQTVPDDPPLFRLPFAADITAAFEYLLATDELVELSAPDLHDYVWPGVMQWHNNNGRTSMLACAVKVGDQPVGVLGMGFRCSTDMSRSQRELIRALANHLALAVHLTRLSKKANSAALVDERNRIARDIHDSLAQNFTGILMQLQAADRLSERDPQIAWACVDRAETLARKGLNEARRSVMSLVKEDERYQDIALALRSLVETATADTGIRAVVNISGAIQSLHPLTAVNLLRVCQEALGNAQRYARAKQITVKLAFTDKSVRLSVEDDGVGFVHADVTGGGFGLAGMQERAERINGMLIIDSAPGKGTRIVIEGPLSASAEVLH